MLTPPRATDDGTDPRYRKTQKRRGVPGLITEVHDDGVYLRFAPLQRSFRRVPAGEIAAVEADTYRPGEHGGWHWGVRIGPGGDATAYRIGGREGVTLRFADGTSLFVGSQRPAELAAAIRTVRGTQPGDSTPG